MTCIATEVTTEIANLRRPRLLIRAARIAAQDYCRSRDLARQGACRGPGILVWLLTQESALNSARLAHDAGYEPAEHVRYLAALLAESRGQFTPAVPK